MDREILLKYDMPVPRYTSYPTAPQFHDGIDSDTYASWLRELDGGIDLSLYVHVPFCRRLCWFCGCNMKVVNRDGPIVDYIDLLRREVEMVASRMDHHGRVTHLHFGGGTPTIIPPDPFNLLMTDLRQAFQFDANAEIAVEIDPRTLSAETIDCLAEAGINRASLGVQDVSPAVQLAINRVQPVERTAECVDQLHRVGITDLNVDIMYGLPGQSVDCVVETVDEVAKLAPGRVALFGYAHVPWMKKHQKQIDTKVLPGSAERLDSAMAAAQRLAEKGYVPIGLDHFAHPDDPLARAADDGQLRRNFQGYTTDAAGALIGLGVSAIGALPQGYIQNTGDLAAYRERVNKAIFPVERGVAVDADDRLRRAAIERLMCDMKVDLAALRREHGAEPDAFADVMESLRPLARDGLVDIGEDDMIDVPEDARPTLRVVCAAFDGYLKAGRGRHSTSL